MRKIWLLLILLLILPSVKAATISGEIYDLDFTLVKNVIVTIDSNPVQKIISEDGTYNFNLDKGDYVITARYYVDGILVSDTNEQVKIEDDGNYTIDLILFPSDEENQFLLDLDDNITDEDNSKSLDYLSALIIILLVIIVLLLRWKPKKKETKLELGENEAEKVLEFIVKNNGRVTQKDIRKAFSLSEAKASLIITELEHKGKVTRVKKGRGNVIILK